MKLEREYKMLTELEQRKRKSEGRKFIENILKKSGDNIGTQLVTYGMGTAVNKIAGKNIVSPGKQQQKSKA